MPGSRHGFSRRDGGFGAAGVSSGPYTRFNLAGHVGDDPAAVAANRRQLSRQCDDLPVAFMEQVHGSVVTVLDAPPHEDVPATDALVTTTPGVALAVLVADCVPVLVWGQDGEVAAVVHAGRLGVGAGIVEATMRTIVELGISPHALRAATGPSIGGCCYEVPTAMQDEVCAVAPQARATTRWGTPGLDLHAAVVAQLLAAGVRDVQVSGVCTYENPEYFSFRRDGVTGRFAGTVVLVP